MWKIVICDDEKRTRDQLQSYLKIYAVEHQEEIEPLLYSSANDLLANYPKDVDLLLLDIYMAGIDGMAAAKQIRTFDPTVTIIFITTMYQMALEGYSVRAYGFVRKPISYDEFRHEMECALRHIQSTIKKETFITLKSGDAVHRLPVSRIQYCEVQNHSMRVCVDGEMQEYRCQMNEMEEQLKPYGFFRCHASFLVNAAYIRTIEPLRVVLQNGAVIPVSQRRRKDFMAELGAYAGGRI